MYAPVLNIDKYKTRAMQFGFAGKIKTINVTMPIEDIWKLKAHENNVSISELVGKLTKVTQTRYFRIGNVKINYDNSTMDELNIDLHVKDLGGKPTWKKE